MYYPRQSSFNSAQSSKSEMETDCDRDHKINLTKPSASGIIIFRLQTSSPSSRTFQNKISNLQQGGFIKQNRKV